MTDLIAAVARADLTAALARAVGGVPVLGTLPPALYPPCVLVGEATPFLSAARDQRAAVTAAFQVIALVDQGADNQRIVDDLDALVSRIVQGLVLDYSVIADAYETITFPNQQPYLGCRITIESGIWNLT